MIFHGFKKRYLEVWKTFNNREIGLISQRVMSPAEFWNLLHGPAQGVSFTCLFVQHSPDSSPWARARSDKCYTCPYGRQAAQDNLEKTRSMIISIYFFSVPPKPCNPCLSGLNLFTCRECLGFVCFQHSSQGSNKVHIFISIMFICSPNPMFDHLLESSR